jgi:hypothetical protein
MKRLKNNNRNSIKDLKNKKILIYHNYLKYHKYHKYLNQKEIINKNNKIKINNLIDHFLKNEMNLIFLNLVKIYRLCIQQLQHIEVNLIKILK